MAHLVFADTQPNAEKPKEPFLSNAPTESYKKLRKNSCKTNISCNFDKIVKAKISR